MFCSPLSQQCSPAEGWRLWQEGYLDVMMPILEATIKRSSSKRRRGKADPADKARRRKEIIARNKRQAKARGGIFKVRLPACSSPA